MSVAQSCLTLCDPMDCSPPGYSVHGILQARILKWVAISVSRVSSQPGNWTQVSCIAGRCFTVWATREGLVLICSIQVLKNFKIYIGVYLTNSVVLVSGVQSIFELILYFTYNVITLQLHDLIYPYLSIGLWGACINSHVYLGYELRSLSSCLL